MKKFTIIWIFILALSMTSLSQAFTQHNFKYQGSCTLETAVNTNDANGNKVAVYQCVNQSSSISVYRINVITFKAIITDTEEYYKSLKREYANLGEPTSTTLKGRKAIQVIENVNIEGHSMKQISVSTLYKNKAITLVLVTNSSNYSSLINSFKNNFSFL